MSVSLEKTSMPSEQDGGSTVDYAKMIEEAQPDKAVDVDAGRIANIDLAQDMANAANGAETARKMHGEYAKRAAVEGAAQVDINKMIGQAETARQAADRAYDKVATTHARVEDLKR